MHEGMAVQLKLWGDGCPLTYLIISLLICTSLTYQSTSFFICSLIFLPTYLFSFPFAFPCTYEAMASHITKWGDGCPIECVKGWLPSLLHEGMMPNLYVRVWLPNLICKGLAGQSNMWGVAAQSNTKGMAIKGMAVIPIFEGMAEIRRQVDKQVSKQICR